MAASIVRQIMRPPLYVEAGTHLSAVVRTLLEHHILGLPVVDSAHRVIGFVSEQDCIHAIMVSSYHCEGWPVVNEVMHSEPFTVSPDELIVDLAQRMGKNKPKVYPVTDRDQVLLGIVTRADVLCALAANRDACDLPSAELQRRRTG